LIGTLFAESLTINKKKMDKNGYSPRFTTIILLALIVGQVLTFNYLKTEFNKQINQCYEAINASTIIQGALVNLLVKKNIIDRDQLLKEAGALTSNLGAMMEKMKEETKEGKNTTQQPEPKVNK
jgi:hypothetical protein